MEKTAKAIRTTETARMIAAELKRRALAMLSLISFTRFTFPKYRVNWHHKLIADYLDKVISDQLKRLMIFTPPRHGKTELVGRRFPPFALGRNPDLRIVSASYASDLARTTNRDVQRVIDDEQYQLLFPSTQLHGDLVRSTTKGNWIRNTDEFEIVNHKGCYKSVGVMTGLTGRGFNIGVIDDPIKDRLEASSETYRDRIWDWYNSVFYTRRDNDDAAIVIISTRWHQDDLCGRLLEQDKAKKEWTVISLPATKENTPSLYDSRKEGEALWPQLFSLSALADIQSQIGPYEYSALYQQHPTPRGGGMFNVERFKLVQMVDDKQVYARVRYWDKAGTAGGGCYTAGVLIYRMQDGSAAVVDVVRGQWEAGEREMHIKQTAELDGPSTKIWIEQEPGSGGLESVQNSIRNLSGYTAKADRVTGDKATRAEPYSAQVDAGNVVVLNREWTKAFLEEHEHFPNGKYKDQVDSAAGAFNKLFVGLRKIFPHVGSAPRPEEIVKPVYDDLLAKANSPEERQEMERMIADASKELVTA